MEVKYIKFISKQRMKESINELPTRLDTYIHLFKKSHCIV